MHRIGIVRVYTDNVHERVINVVKQLSTHIVVTIVKIKVIHNLSMTVDNLTLV